MPRTLRFVYSGIRVRDLARSVRFYRRLGFQVVQRGSFSHGGRYVHLTLSGSNHRLELNYYPRSSRFYTPLRRGEEFDHFGFYASDPDQWLTAVRRAGARYKVGYTDRPGQQLYFVEDPNGVWLGVFGPIRPRKAKNRSSRVAAGESERAKRTHRPKGSRAK